MSDTAVKQSPASATGRAPGVSGAREGRRASASPSRPGAPRAGKNDTPLGRYVRILESVSASRSGLTLTEIANESGLQAGTAHRLLRGLVDLGLLRARSESKRYVPGPRLKNLLHLTLGMAEYAGLARSILDRLVEDFGETVHLARLNGDWAESVLMKQPQGSDRAFVQPGRRLPLYAAASGKAILAFQSEGFVSRYLTRPRVRYTDRTKVGDAEILREMARVREEGMAVCENELDAGVLSYGHPVPAGEGPVLYSIGITGLADRFRLVERARIRERLSEAAAELSRSLGFDE